MTHLFTVFSNRFRSFNVFSLFTAYISSTSRSHGFPHRFLVEQAIMATEQYSENKVIRKKRASAKMDVSTRCFLLTEQVCAARALLNAWRIFLSSSIVSCCPSTYRTLMESSWQQHHAH